ncbi:MAG TPA: NRDE family protein [Verrucomicrobiae bacterium]|jgi:hypothetical protein|nr:NRDE family protein [Verrucomicrobiae bacterium]
MCTVSFIARQRGYLLAMNRDEKLSRIKALPPQTISVEGRTLICPSEPGGGTWIALNDAGGAFALINWYSVKAAVEINPFSRGGVVTAVATQISAAAASKSITQLPLTKINPFRLIGIFQARRKVFEWRWNLKTLVCEEQPWKSQQWISSGYDEPQAQRIRSKTFQLALRQKSAGSLAWLRRLHRSHTPAPGPFSTCMHRADAATVSYTEIVATYRHASMIYGPEAPCQCVMRTGRTSRPAPSAA